jgi:hypothetical protein
MVAAASWKNSSLIASEPFCRVCNGAARADRVRKIAIAPLRTLSGLATRFCTPYAVSDAVALPAYSKCCAVADALNQ